MKKIIFKAMSLLATPLFLISCVEQSSEQLTQLVYLQGNSLQEMQNRLDNMQPTQASQWSQVQTIQQELAQLRGDIDNINNATANLGGSQNIGTMINRHERALRLIETQLAMDLQLNDEGKNLPVFDEQSKKHVPPAYVNQQNQQTNNDFNNPSSTSKKDPLAIAKPSTPDTAQSLYDSGINAFNSRDYEKGLDAFVDFTKVFPKHKLISNAWFWQGECNYQLKNYAASALAYEKVISNFPNSNKAPASYLKQGLSFIRLERIAAAKERLHQLIRIYPKSVEARRAKQILKNVK